MIYRSRPSFYLIGLIAAVNIALYNYIAYTHESPTDKVDQLFSQFNETTPGAAIAIVHHGEVVYAQGYGMANLEYDIPITPKTVFHVASVSKQFTAFAILMLAADGKLSLDDDVRVYMPEFPDFGETITIRHLIHHTSGLRDQWELLAMAGWRMDDVITREHILKMLSHQRELNFKPGTEYLYSNMGYSVLAEIVERVSGQSFPEWTHEHIFKPLGMERTHFHYDHRLIVRDRAYSYQPAPGGGYQKSVLNYANVGATSLFTTVEDLAKWLLNFEKHTVGSPQIFNQMHERARLNNGNRTNYAFALAFSEYRGALTVGHGGADAGYRAHIVRFPEHDFAVVVLSNLSTTLPQQIAHRVADIYLDDVLTPVKARVEPQIPERIHVDPSLMDSYVGKYKMQPGLVISLTREDDRLLMQTLGQSKAELIPMNEVTFYRSDIDLLVTFEMSDDGNVYHLVINQGGQTVPAIRIDGFKPSPDRLQQYVGEYYSEELGTAYTIVNRDGVLVATHRRHSDIELTPIVTDRFSGDQWWFRTVEFVRDDKNSIRGFRLSGGRVRNVWFEKR